MFCATISVALRLFPSLSSHWRYEIRPSAQMLRPFDRMLLSASPRLPQTMTVCQSVRCWRSPARLT